MTVYAAPRVPPQRVPPSARRVPQGPLVLAPAEALLHAIPEQPCRCAIAKAGVVQTSLL